MKKLGICCLVLVVAAMFVPASQAATKCINLLPNFCDLIQYDQFKVGGIQGTELVGLWDFECAFLGTGTLVSGRPGQFGTQPVDLFGGGPAGFNANFALHSQTRTADLYGTFDGMSTFAFQIGIPYNVTKGACSPLTPTQKSLPRAVGVGIR